MKYPASRIFAHASFVTACNLAAANALQRQCPWIQSRLQLIHHGVKLTAWKYMGDYRQPSSLKILFVGRLVAKKGLPNLFHALKILHESHLEASLAIVGDGPEKGALRALAESLDIAEAITWLGVKPQQELPELFTSFSCLCLPSIMASDGDQDGIPNVIVEAMAAGLPVVASQAGSIPEVLTEKTGWAVAEMTPRSLATALIECTAHPEESEQRRKNARMLVECNYDAVKLAEKRAYLFQNVKSSDSLFVK